MSLELKLGRVESFCVELSFDLIVDPDGDAYLRIFASDPSDLRKAGVLLRLDGSEYRRLKAVIEKTDRTIGKLTDSGRIRRLRVS